MFTIAIINAFLDMSVLRAIYAEEEESLYFGRANKLLHDIKTLFFEHAVVFAIISMFLIAIFVIFSSCILYYCARCSQKMCSCCKSSESNNIENTPPSRFNIMSLYSKKNKCCECVYRTFWCFKRCCSSSHFQDSDLVETSTEEEDFEMVNISGLDPDYDGGDGDTEKRKQH